jgi:hypothetical protein
MPGTRRFLYCTRSKSNCDYFELRIVTEGQGLSVQRPVGMHDEEL